MKTIQVKSKIDQDGHLRLDIPTDYKPGDVDVDIVVVIDSHKKNNYDFSDLVGKISKKIDPIALQQELRNEWE